MTTNNSRPFIFHSPLLNVRRNSLLNSMSHAPSTHANTLRGLFTLAACLLLFGAARGGEGASLDSYSARPSSTPQDVASRPRARVAVLDFGETATGLRASQQVADAIATGEHVALVERGQSRMAARGMGY
ncbi:MAG TPA: hypothetical protein VFX96_02130, partial [Pyrinomonadaceae bacterium]|nr:hypothetical protein [Pyrinomonadaceae bacterium]